MLNRAKVVRQLQQEAHRLFVHDQDTLSRIYALWSRIIQDPLLAQRVQHAQAPWPLPVWQGCIDWIIELAPLCEVYTALSVDGSQIYPDRHQGTNCSLVNVGSVAITYGYQAGTVYFDSQPYIFFDEMYAGLPLVHDAIDYIRQEYECMTAANLATKYVTTSTPGVVLFDGTLIFWQLETKGSIYKHYFLPQYCSYLNALVLPVVGYISAPRSKELANVLRFILCEEGIAQEEANQLVASVTDAMLLKSLLTPYTRTTVFMSRSGICSEYPEHLRPYFWYLHVGAEIARIESPAWVAHNTQLVDQISTIILDQCAKGCGYPIVLAEAHEQAVVKSADRDFFYQCIAKISIERNHCLRPSQKSIKKRGLGI